MYKLVIVHRGRIEKNIPLRHDSMIIGRKSESDIRLDENLVSARHARIFQKNGRVYIDDMSSTNGTRVNGERINEARLQTGDQISIGNYKLVFVTEHGDTNDPDATVIVSSQRRGPDASQQLSPSDTQKIPGISKPRLALYALLLSIVVVAGMLLLTV
ncbi:MAG: FHA domain-containing protein [Chromatiales bacterium]|jgi:pSer/pThr/pTyr-binding forkhead associated (FHA) protein